MLKYKIKASLNMKATNIIPIGLYTHEEKNRCKLIHQVFKNGKFVFPDTYLTLKLKKIYYIFSPSILPLPPSVKIYYTIENTKEPYNIIDIQELTDSYDFTGILNIDSKLGTDKNIGIFFGAYRKPVSNTVALTSYVKNTIDKSLYLSENDKLPGDWISKFHSNSRIISPIFFLETSKLGFKKENNICYPDKTSKMSINNCMNSIVPRKINIQEISYTPQLSFQGSGSGGDTCDTRSSLFKTLLIITCIVSLLIIFMSFIFHKYT